MLRNDMGIPSNVRIVIKKRENESLFSHWNSEKRSKNGIPVLSSFLNFCYSKYSYKDYLRYIL